LNSILIARITSEIRMRVKNFASWLSR